MKAELIVPSNFGEVELGELVDAVNLTMRAGLKIEQVTTTKITGDPAGLKVMETVFKAGVRQAKAKPVKRRGPRLLTAKKAQEAKASPSVTRVTNVGGVDVKSARRIGPRSLREVKSGQIFATARVKRMLKAREIDPLTVFENRFGNRFVVMDDAKTGQLDLVKEPKE